jgi:tetratricopeptide (TPR) repeat protein
MTHSCSDQNLLVWTSYFLRRTKCWMRSLPFRLASIAFVYSLIASLGCNRSAWDDEATDNSTSNTNTSQASQASPSSQTNGNASQEVTAANIVEAATRLLERQDIDGGWQLVQSGLLRFPDDPALLFLAARVLAFQQKFPEAIALLDKIPSDDSQAGLPALGQGAEWALQLGDLRTAEERLLRIVQLAPTSPLRPMVARMLTQIYNVQGRRWEAGQQVMELIRRGDFNERELLMMVNLREPFADAEVSKAAKAFKPDDPLLQLGDARLLFFQSKDVEALSLLEGIRRALPQSLEPWVLHGAVLVNLERFDQLKDWHRVAPQGYESHPEYWLVMGHWAKHENRWESAARGFVEAIRRDSRSIVGHQELGECLARLGLNDQAASARDRASKLIEIAGIVPNVTHPQRGVDFMRKVAMRYEALDDKILNWAWQAVAAFASKQPLSNDLVMQLQGLKQHLPAPSDFVESFAKNNWPMPHELLDLPASANLATSSVDANTRPTISIRFEEVTDQTGIRFQFMHSGDVTRGLNIYQGIGGGCAAFDYDRDGACDLYFSQAGAAPTAVTGFLPKQLFRASKNLQFQNVTSQAFIEDFGYGQGLADADYDQDGFIDLVVANIGSVQVYRNLGDGTFDLAFVFENLPNEEWNSSVAMGDINGDCLPDLLHCGYCLGPDYLTQNCPNPNAVAITCHPRNFPPCPNHILINQGDGTWKLVDKAIETSIADGYTLGVLISNIDQQFGNDVFYANDNSANHLLLSQPSEHGGWTAREKGSSSGVAVSGSGRAQACMGLAMGDVDRNGKFDLIVTNFRNDVNTVYLQSAPGVFYDGTRNVNMHKDSWDWLGFGCQLVDFDLDGWLDFAVVNGHIDDYRKIGDPFYMPAQVLRNERGRFRWLQKSESPGGYFDRDHLGRGLVQADLNRDGRMDLIATHLEEPVSVLLNKTETNNCFLQFELVGVTADRDAVGAVVQITAGKESWTLARSDGDGFYGSNENVLHVGLGQVDQVDSIQITWPDGKNQKLEGVKTNQRLLVVQDQEPLR